MSEIQIKRPDFMAVKRLAQQVLEENFIVKPPVIAASLAKTYRLEVFESDFKPDYAHIAGFIDFDKNIILLNAADSPNRKNFTAAHELGHYLLKHREAGGYAVMLRDTTKMVKTPFEQEANRFAAHVLVPEPFLREYLDNYPFITNWQLSRLFGVSEEVIRYRRLYVQ